MPAERRATVDAQIARETLRLEVLVRRFADYARLKGGNDLVVRPRATPLERVTREAAEAVVGGERVEITITDGTPHVLVDPDRFRAALAAVLHNALRYSPAAMPVRITARAGDGGVVLCVDDRGEGVPAPERERVFAEGWRGVVADGHDGAGLGLFLARALLHAQDGRIEATDAPGGGARFVIRLRAAA